MKKSIIALLCVLLILVPFIVACDSESETSQEESSVVSEQSETSQAGTEEDVFPYEDVKYSNKTVTIFTVDYKRNIYGEVQFAPTDETEGNVVNEAVKARNDYIYEKHGVIIDFVSENYPTNHLKNAIENDEVNFDAVCAGVDNMLLRCLDGYFISIDSVLNLDDPWWDQRANDMLSPDGVKHYFVAGELMLLDSEHIYMTMFNKKLYNENLVIAETYGDIYDLVTDGKFTYDTFTEICKLASVPDSEGNMTKDATFGNLSHGFGGTIFFNGSGIGLAEKDSNGELRITVADEKSVAVFDKVFNLTADNNITMRAEMLKSGEDAYGYGGLRKMFEEGRGLFYNTTVSAISSLKQLEEGLDFSFGVLPIPKYDEAQAEYYCAVNRYHSGVIGIPIITKCNDLELIGFALNALGFYNTHGKGDKSVMDAYYEVTLKTQGTDQTEDEAMLDLIFNSKIYDLGSIYSWDSARLIHMVTNIINSGTNTWLSTFEASRSAIEADMNKTIETLRGLDL